jgi:hypothetical protein
LDFLQTALRFPASKIGKSHCVRMPGDEPQEDKLFAADETNPPQKNHCLRQSAFACCDMVNSLGAVVNVKNRKQISP